MGNRKKKTPMLQTMTWWSRNSVKMEWVPVVFDLVSRPPLYFFHPKSLTFSPIISRKSEKLAVILLFAKKLFSLFWFGPTYKTPNLKLLVTANFFLFWKFFGTFFFFFCFLWEYLGSFRIWLNGFADLNQIFPLIGRCLLQDIIFSTLECNLHDLCKSLRAKLFWFERFSEYFLFECFTFFTKSCDIFICPEYSLEKVWIIFQWHTQRNRNVANGIIS